MVKYLLGILTGIFVVVIIIIISNALKPAEDSPKKTEKNEEEFVTLPKELGEIITSESAEEKLKIVDHSSSLDKSGYLFVIGDVENISKSVVTPVVIEVSFLNEEGELLELLSDDFGSLTVGEHWLFSIKSNYKNSAKYYIEVKTK